jgi:serine protease Do
MAADVMDQLVKNGRVRRGRLGVSVQGMTSDLAQSFGLEEVGGALISGVDADGPAARAGLALGDVVLSVDGEDVRDGNDLRNRIARRAPETPVRLEVLRGEERRSFEITLGEMGSSNPGDTGGAGSSGEGRYGLTVAPLTPEVARQLGTETRSGVVVTEVDPAGPAGAAGIQRGDVILEVGRRPIASVDALKAALDAAGERPALVLLERRGTTLFLALSR